MNTAQFWIDNYTTILSFLGASGGVAIILQLVKKYFKLDGTKTVHVLLALFALLPAVADYIINYGQQMPGQIPQNFAFIVTGAIYVHKFFVSPISKKIENWLNTTYADAQKYQAEQTVSTNAPISNTNVTLNSASVPSVFAARPISDVQTTDAPLQLDQ